MKVNPDLVIKKARSERREIMAALELSPFDDERLLRLAELNNIITIYEIHNPRNATHGSSHSVQQSNLS